VTGYTTAKVTAGHGAIYASIAGSFGADGARTYAESNQAALEWIAERVESESIDCDFERVPNYIYAETAEEAQMLRDEAEAEQRAGLPASFVDETPLPFKVAGAVRLENQAQFHPRKYLLALAAALPGDGSHVFELTRALRVHRGEPHRVDTDRGEIRASDVILATHIPFLDRGLFFAKAHPHRKQAPPARRRRRSPTGRGARHRASLPHSRKLCSRPVRGRRRRDAPLVDAGLPHG
jgi:glycine/D-amino acid oxidase-like deaminating enzyme